MVDAPCAVIDYRAINNKRLESALILHLEFDIYPAVKAMVKPAY